MSNLNPQFHDNEDFGQNERRWRKGFFSGHISSLGGLDLSKADGPAAGAVFRMGASAMKSPEK